MRAKTGTKWQAKSRGKVRDKLGLNGRLNKGWLAAVWPMKKLMDLLEYVYFLDEVMHEDWEEDQVDRPLTRNRKGPLQMYGDIEFKLTYGLRKR
uniref:Uncharacterized protein n=1 Tax=Romanomermis culicivorax TaxID=13658 RepID=A0A915K6J4_ROMCU